MGGGLKKFLPPTGSPHGAGNRLEQDLVEAWKKDKESRNLKSMFVSNLKGLEHVDESKTDYLLGTKNDQQFLSARILRNDS